jgi:hypothetical protein
MGAEKALQRMNFAVVAGFHGERDDRALEQTYERTGKEECSQKSL